MISLIVLAAGLGRRFGGAKQLTPVGPSGEALCDYAIFDAVRAGFESIVIVTHPDLERAFHEHLSSTLPLVTSRRIVLQAPPPAPRQRPLGTAHALLSAADTATGPVAVCNADDWYGPSAFVAMADFLRRGETGTYGVAGYRMAQTTSPAGGVSRALLEVDDDGWVRSVEELVGVRRAGGGLVALDSAERNRTVADDAWTSMNLWGLSDDAFPAFESQFVRFLASDPTAEREFGLSDAIQGQLAEATVRLRLLPSEDAWFGLTHPQDLPAVRARVAALVAQKRYPPSLGSAVRS